MAYLRYYLAPAMTAAGVLGFVLGGSAVWLGLATFPLVTLLDLFALRPDFSRPAIRHPRLAAVPLYLHAALMPALVAMAALRIHVGNADGALTPSELIGSAASLAWLGVVPNIPVAHELMHSKSRVSRFIAFLLTAVIADPLRRLAHMRGHHIKVALPDDTDTARRGETIYAFIVRAAIGGTREAFRSEVARGRSEGHSVWSWRSDVTRSLLLTAAVLSLLYVLAGPVALVTLAAGFVLSRLLLESFNYLQHYGIVRAEDSRFGPRHAWSHLTPVVRAATVEITNHAHHHMSTLVPFYALEPDREAPQMPSALLCFLCALVPPLWVRWIAMPKLRHWDSHFATPEERTLAQAANAAAGWPAW